MTRCLAAVFHGTARHLELREFEVPRPGRAELLVRVLGCTLCGSDLHTFEGRRTVPVPTILGHEIVGEIADIGEAAPTHDLAGVSLRVGDRVTWGTIASCGSCFRCQRGLPQKCLRGVKYGHEPLRPGRELLGGLAEYCLLVPGTALLRLSDDMPLEVACPASCATATVAAALEVAGEMADRTVCILGCGLLGLTACAMARVLGAAEVIAVDVHDSRRQRSLAFGASEAIRPENLSTVVEHRTQGNGVDVVLELTGAPVAFTSAWPIVRPGGVIVLVGSVFPSEPVPLALEQVVRRNLHLHGVHNYAPQHLLTAVQFLSAQGMRFPFAELVTDWFSLPDVAATFAAATDLSRVRVGVRRDT